MKVANPPIMALATAPVPSPIAIVRLSGGGSHQALRQCLEPVVSGSDWPHGQLSLCRLTDPQSHQLIDKPMAVFFYGSRSYTGEESAEIHLHGGVFIMRSCMEILARLGFRQADPGEFTRRAFLNGKMDLTAAEGVKTLIEASSEAQWKAGRDLAEGRLKKKIDALRSTLTQAMAYLEALIDFPDEGDTASVHLVEVDQRVQDVSSQVDALLQSYQSGKVARHGLAVALLGPPNVGKSTLLNTLLGEERAIVTAVPGTTRDYIEESCVLNGRLFRFIDTAGVRETEDEVETLGVERSLRLAAEADLVLLLSSDDTDSSHLAERSKALAPHVVSVHSKVDKEEGACQEEGQSHLVISCHTGFGLECLRRRLLSVIDRRIKEVDDTVFVSSERQRRALQASLESLAKYREARSNHAYEDMLAFELREAATHLGAVVGEVTAEDVFDQVFSSFCVGK